MQQGGANAPVDNEVILSGSIPRYLHNKVVDLRYGGIRLETRTCSCWLLPEAVHLWGLTCSRDSLAFDAIYRLR